MYFLSWIIIGLVAGWSAGKILKGNGPLMDIAIGIGGAVAGGFLVRSGLAPAKDFVLRIPAAPNGEVTTRQYSAPISSFRNSQEI